MAGTFASTLNSKREWQAPIRVTKAPRRLCFTAILEILAKWEERKRFRIKLEDMLMTAPHLISDVGLTRTEVEAEISKPFWRD